MLAKFVQQAIHLNCGFEDLGQDLVRVVDVLFIQYIMPFGLDDVKHKTIYQDLNGDLLPTK